MASTKITCMNEPDVVEKSVTWTNVVGWLTSSCLAMGCTVFDDTLPLETESEAASTASTTEDGSASTHSSAGSSSTSTTVDPDGGSTSSSSSEVEGTVGDDTDTTTGGRPSCNDSPTPADELAFGPPVPLPGANSPDYDGYAWLSPNELEVWLATVRPEGPGGIDIFWSTRSDPTEAFGPAMLLAGVSTPAHEGSASLTADALTLYASMDDPAGEAGGEIGISTRATTVAEFDALAPVANINSSAHEGQPYVAADGSELYFATTRAGTWDIYRAELGAGGSFGAATAVPGLATADNDLNPVPSTDGLTMYFASNRDDPALDVYVATRSTRDDGFGPAVRLTDVNSGDADWPVWVSHDGCRLVLSSSRPGQGNWDLWIAEREP